jgi:hypothetical protein
MEAAIAAAMAARAESTVGSLKQLHVWRIRDQDFCWPTHRPAWRLDRLLVQKQRPYAATERRLESRENIL